MRPLAEMLGRQRAGRQPRRRLWPEPILLRNRLTIPPAAHASQATGSAEMPPIMWKENEGETI